MYSSCERGFDYGGFALFGWRLQPLFSLKRTILSENKSYIVSLPRKTCWRFKVVLWTFATVSRSRSRKSSQSPPWSRKNCMVVNDCRGELRRSGTSPFPSLYPWYHTVSARPLFWPPAGLGESRRSGKGGLTPPTFFIDKGVGNSDILSDKNNGLLRRFHSLRMVLYLQAYKKPVQAKYEAPYGLSLT